ISAELIILFPLLRITQHFVGFVDLLKFLLRHLFILGYIWMVFPRQLTKRGANLIFARGFTHPEGLVIISELNWHPLKLLRTRDEVQMAQLSPTGNATRTHPCGRNYQDARYRPIS